MPLLYSQVPRKIHKLAMWSSGSPPAILAGFRRGGGRDRWGEDREGSATHLEVDSWRWVGRRSRWRVVVARSWRHSRYEWKFRRGRGNARQWVAVVARRGPRGDAGGVGGRRERAEGGVRWRRWLQWRAAELGEVAKAVHT
jgi:hypothetical protein